MDQAMTLLIVEDEPEILELLAENLSLLNVKLLTATNGQEALSVMESNPDVTAIISDINMPVMSGIECLQKLRDRGIETPVIFLTAYTERQKLSNAIRLGAYDFLDKPCGISQLIQKAKHALKFGLLLSDMKREFEDIFKKYGVSIEDQQKIRSLQRDTISAKIA